MGSGEGTLVIIGHALGNCHANVSLPAGFSHPAGSSSVPGVAPLLLQLQWVPCRQPQQDRAEQEVPHNLQQRAERGVSGDPSNPSSENPKWKVFCKGETSDGNNEDKNHQNNCSSCKSQNN